jgi:hypothetical protein
VLLQSAQGLSAAADATLQQLVTGAPIHLGLGGDPLAGLAEQLRAFTVEVLRAADVQPQVLLPVTAPHPFRALFAETSAGHRVGIWRSHQKFRTLRGSVAAAFEGGAAVHVREHLDLTAGFRLLGYEPGEEARLEGGKLDASSAAPFLGLALRF